MKTIKTVLIILCFALVACVPRQKPKCVSCDLPPVVNCTTVIGHSQSYVECVFSNEGISDIDGVCVTVVALSQLDLLAQEIGGENIGENTDLLSLNATLCSGKLYSHSSVVKRSYLDTNKYFSNCVLHVERKDGKKIPVDFCLYDILPSIFNPVPVAAYFTQKMARMGTEELYKSPNSL